MRKTIHVFQRLPTRAIVPPTPPKPTTAVKDVERAKRGATVAHVEPDDLVNASEVARRLACTREYVRLLVAGQRGRGGFPVPLAGVTGTTLFWSWAAVVRWLLE